MKQLKIRIHCLFLILCMLFHFSGLINAENTDSRDYYPEQRWGIGIGLRYADIPFESSNESVTDLVPLFYYEDDRFFLNGMEGGIKVIDGDGWRINGFLRYRFPDAPRELEEDVRRDAWDAGFQLRHTLYTDWNVIWNLMTDMKGRQYLDAGVETLIGDDFFSLRPYAGVRLKTKSFNNYYFGLNSESIGSGIDFSARIDARRHITGNFFLIGSLGGSFLDSNARRSAYVKDKIVWEAYAGIAFFNNPEKDLKKSLPISPYWRLAHGFATSSTIGSIIQLDIDSDPYNNQLTSVFYGHPLTNRLFRLPLDIYLTPGIVLHHSSDVQNYFFEYVMAIKAYYTINWPVRLRFGAAEGLSYSRQISYIEKTNLERKNDQSSRLLNYLDISLDLNLGDLIRTPAAKKMWLGYSLHHRSGIFKTGSQFGRMRGGSNYNTFYLQIHY